jgi:hypothetical protein
MVINGFTLSQRDYSNYHVVSVMPCIVREPAIGHFPPSRRWGPKDDRNRVSFPIVPSHPALKAASTRAGHPLLTPRD